MSDTVKNRTARPLPQPTNRPRKATRKLAFDSLEDRSVPATFHVALTGLDSNPGTTAAPFRTIQAAINAAAATNDGADTVNVAGGTYNTALVDERFDITTSANLSNLQLLGGWNAAFTVRNPVVTPTDYTFTNSPVSNRYDIRVVNPNSTIDGFTFRSSDGTTTRLADTILVDNGGTNATISNNTIIAGIMNGGSRPVGILSGINVDTSGLQILNNTINVNFTGTATTSTAGIGIFINSSTQTGTVLVDGNTINGNNMNSGIIVSGVDNVTVQNNVVNRNTPLFGAGIELRNNIRTLNNTTVINNTFSDVNLSPSNSAAGIVIGGSGGLNAAITNTVIRGNLVSTAGPSSPGLNARQGTVVASTLIERNSITSTVANASAFSQGPVGLDVSGNWLGSATALGVSGAIGANSGGSIVARSFLSSGTDASAAPGFQLPGTTEMLVPQTFATAAIPEVDGLIQSGVDRAAPGMTVTTADDNYTGNVLINKSLTLQSTSGRAVTTITGVSGVGALGSVQVTPSVDDVTIGTAGRGFTIVGIDNGNQAIDNAAIYFQGAHNNVQVRSNDIVANGDGGLVAEYGYTNTNWTIDGNIFSGQTFVGPNPAGNGNFGANQYVVPNYPRQLFVIGSGGGGAASGAGLASNITFTNNQITGTAGGTNGGGEQGNTLVTIDAGNSTITGNTFAGTTTLFGSALRVRRPGTTISGNTLNTAGMSPTTNLLYLENNALPIQTIIAANLPDKGAYIVGGTTVWKSVQVALAASAASGNTIRVLPGNYAENITVDNFASTTTSVTVDGLPGATINPGAGNAFTIPSGVLASFTGSFNTGAFPTVVQSGGTIGGTGTITGPVTVNAGGFMAPGFSPGIINTGNYNQAGTLNIEVVSPASLAPVAGTDNDQVNVTGSVTLTGSLNLTVTGAGTIPTGAPFVIVNNDGGDAVTGTFTGLPNGSLVTSGLQNFAIFYNGGDGNDVVLVKIAAPSAATVFVDQSADYVITFDTGVAGLSVGDTVTWNPSAAAHPAGIQANLTYGFNAFNTIQNGVNAVNASGVVNVAAGTYAENVTINKSLQLIGAKSAVSPNTRFAAFTGGPNNPKASALSEAIITAATNNPLGGNPGAEDLIRVTSNNVTISGFVLDGNNPALGLSANQTATGVDVHARRGITNIDNANGFNPVSNLVVGDNIIQNVSQRGVSLANNGPVSTGNTITANLIRTYGSDPVNGGHGILLFTNAYADIVGNTVVVPDNQIGIQLQNFFSNGSMTWSGNTVTVGQDAIGILANLFYAPSATLAISSNTVNAAAGVTGTSDFTWGIYALSVQNGSAVPLTGNTIGASGGQFARGINLWNLPTTTPTSISGGTISNSVVGVNLDTIDPLFGAGASTTVNVGNVAISGATTGVRVTNAATSTGSTTLNLTNATITNSTTGVLVQDSNADAFTATVALSNVDITGGTTGLRVDGAQALLTGTTLGNTDFTGQSGQYVSLVNGAYDNVEVNGTTATFGGLTGTGATTAQNYTIEDKLTHATDNAAVGFVRVNTGDVYVTQSSGSVQRGIDAAVSGDTLHVNGGNYTGGADAATPAKNINFDLGTSPAQIAITGNLALNAGDTLNIELDGTNAATSYDNLLVTGTVSLGNATLNVTTSNGFVAAQGQVFTIIDNDLADGVGGIFTGRPEGSAITTAPFSVGTQGFIRYTYGSGNDVAIVTNSTPGIISPLAVLTNPPLEGSLVTMQATVVDPDVGVPVGFDKLTYQWNVTGPNAFLASGSTIGSSSLNNNFSFTPTDSGTFVVTLTVTDSYGAVDTEVRNVIVQNVAPTLDISTALINPAYVSGNVVTALRYENVSLQLQNYFDPAGLLDNNYTISVNWGDGTPNTVLSGLAYQTPPSHVVPHTFTTLGTKTVIVTFTDSDGGSTTEAILVDVVPARIDAGTGELIVIGSDGDNVFTYINLAPTQEIQVIVDNVFWGTFGPASTPVPLSLTGTVRTFARGGNDTVNIQGTYLADNLTVQANVTPDAVRDKLFTLATPGNSTSRTYSTLNAESYRMQGGEGGDNFFVAGLGNSVTTRNVTLEGGNGDDVLTSSLTAPDVGVATDWLFEGPERGKIESVLSFNTIATYVGNGLNDIFKFNTGGQAFATNGLASVNGLGGTNTLDLNNVTGTLTIAVQNNGNLTTPVGSAAQVTTIIGSAGTTDRIIGAQLPGTWNVNTANAGTYNVNATTYTFTQVESLVGGSDAADNFIFAATGTLTGSLDGSTGIDTFDVSSKNSNLTATVYPGTLKVGAANVVSSWIGIEELIGGAGSNTLTATNGNNVWDVTGNKSGTLNSSNLTGYLDFTNFGTLIGGTGTDAFLFGTAGVATSINGGTGSAVNKLDFTNAITPVTVNLINSTVPVHLTSTFSNIKSFVGSAAATDQLLLPNTTNAVVINGEKKGTINTSTAFAEFETLVGGTGADTFTFTTTSQTPLVSLQGGAGNDKLVGPNVPNIFDIDGVNSGDVYFNQLAAVTATPFSGIENLTGGSSTDTFIIQTTGSLGTTPLLGGAIAGGSGTDTIDISAFGALGFVNFSTSKVNNIGGKFTVVENFLGNGGSITGANTTSTWKLTALDAGTLNTTTTFAGFSTITGGTGADKLLMGTGRLSGFFDAGATSTADTVDYSGVGNGFTRPYNKNVSGANVMVRNGLDGNLETMLIKRFDKIAGNL